MASLHENKLNGILADDMGMGKTIQSISMLAFLHESLRISGPFLIVAPKSTISNWMKEFKTWAPFFKVVNLIPTKEHRTRILKEEMQPGKFHVVVTTYEALNICETALTVHHKFRYVIFDEAHKLKNADSIISTISRKIKTDHRLLLTGTPL